MDARPRRPGYSRRAQYGLFATYVFTVAATLVVAILLMLSRFDPLTFGALRTTAAEVTTPVSSGLAWVGRGLSAVPQGIADYFAVKQRNAALRAQIRANHRVVMDARGLLFENRRLHRLLALRERSTAPIVSAHLVSSSASSTRRFAVLDVGSRRGVAVGQPVRGPDGLIGRVLEVGYNNARILLITDPESLVPVRRAGDGLPAIAAGRGDGLLDLRAIDAGSAVIRRGDLFVTSGVGGIFPPNVPVATAARSARDIARGRALARADTLDVALVEAPFVPAAATGVIPGTSATAADRPR